MQTIDDLFTFNKTFSPQNLNSFEFYVFPRINGKKQQPSYSALFSLSSRRVLPERLLQVIGAEKAHLRIFHTNAELPILLPYNTDSKLTSFDFVAIQQNADILALLYDYIEGSKRGNETVLDDLFQFDVFPRGIDIPLGKGLLLRRVDGALTMNIYRNQTVYTNVISSNINDYESNHAITFRLYTLIRWLQKLPSKLMCCR